MKRKCITGILLLCLAGCSSPYRLGDQNIAYLYQKDNVAVIDTRVYHDNDTTIKVFFQVKEEHLDLPERHSETPELMVQYELSTYSSDFRIDSSGKSCTGIIDATSGYITGDFNLVVQDTGKYWLDILIRPSGIKRGVRDELFIDNTDKLNRQNFLVLDGDGEVLIGDIMSASEDIRIISNQDMHGELIVFYYKRDFPIALPPFVSKNQKPFNYVPDSVYLISMRDGTTPIFSLPHQGFYHFLADTSSREGLTLYRYYDGFPEITTPYQMFFPLRYITSKKEFSEMMITGNKKLSVEQFWIEKTGSIERAMETLQHYYKQVERANELFTSYLEGWKTDRGLIYIVFGPPNFVYRDLGVITWIYGDGKSGKSTEFNFIKVINPFTDDDYRLIRSQGYKDKWYYAVENLRR